MPRRHGRVHVVRVRKTHVDKQGQRREYTSAYLRRTYRDGTARCATRRWPICRCCPPRRSTAIEATLKGQTLVPAGSEFTHRAVAAARARGRGRGDGAPAGPSHAAGPRVPGTAIIALALIVSRVVRPKSKLSTLAWWPDTTLGVDLGVAGASTDEVYAAMDWLAEPAGQRSRRSSRPNTLPRR